MREAGFDEFPEDTDGFLELCRALAENGTPPGIGGPPTDGGMDGFFFASMVKTT